MNHCPYCNANFIQKMARCPMCGATLSGSEEKKPDREQEKTVKVKKNQEESVSKHEEILEEEKDQEKPGHVLSIPNAVASILGWGFGLMLGFVGIGSTIRGELGVGIPFLLCTLLLIPSLYDYIKNMFNYELSSGIRIALIFIFFFVGGHNITPSQDKMLAPSPTPAPSPAPEVTQVQDLTPTPIPILSPTSIPKDFYSINETINTGDTSIRVAEWGFASEWGSEEPTEGAKFIWINFTTTNIRDVPLKSSLGGGFDYDFSLHYRGTQADRRYGEYDEDHFYSPGYDAYPGITQEGYLLFMVPDSLEDGEADLHIGIDEKLYKFKLVNATPTGDKQISISLQNMTCNYQTHTYEEESGYTKKEVERTEYTCNKIHLVLQNSRIPFFSYNTIISFSIQHSSGLERDTYGPVKLPKSITPNQVFTYSAGINWRLVEGANNYFSGLSRWSKDPPRKIGDHGETIKIVVTIKDDSGDYTTENDQIFGSSELELTLPRLD